MRVRPGPASATVGHAGPIGWVLYDGGCGVCSRWVPSWAPTLARIGLGVRPLQDPSVRERTGLDEAALLRDIRILFVDDRTIAGAEVYRYVMRRTWWATPLWLLSVTPGLRRLFDAGYRAFAEHRHEISDACGLEAGSAGPA